jgi:hypothetical protein
VPGVFDVAAQRHLAAQSSDSIFKQLKTIRNVTSPQPSYSAKAEYPVRRSFSILSLAPRNTGSPAFAGDDG